MLRTPGMKPGMLSGSRTTASGVATRATQRQLKAAARRRSWIATTKGLLFSVTAITSGV
jgi:hypothetical protein